MHAESYNWRVIYEYVFQSGVVYIVGYSFGPLVGTAVAFLMTVVTGFEDSEGNTWEEQYTYQTDPQYVILPNGTIAYL